MGRKRIVIEVSGTANTVAGDMLIIGRLGCRSELVGTVVKVEAIAEEKATDVQRQAEGIAALAMVSFDGMTVSRIERFTEAVRARLEYLKKLWVIDPKPTPPAPLNDRVVKFVDDPGWLENARNVWTDYKRKMDALINPPAPEPCKHEWWDFGSNRMDENTGRSFMIIRCVKCNETHECNIYTYKTGTLRPEPLKPCPFCGGEAIEYTSTGNKGKVGCRDCGVLKHDRAAWNRRVTCR